MRAAPAALILTLAACAAPAPPPAQETALRLAAGGLDVAGTGREIGFGRAPDGAVAAVSRLLGSAPDARRRDAGCETVRWAGGLELAFRDAAFSGWRATPGGLPLRTAAGAAPGGPPVVLPDGVEAAFAPDGRVTALSAGHPCP
ncbi:MAG: hypothetical protein ACLFQF_03910 [Rhodosalinus sp.]